MALLPLSLGVTRFSEKKGASSSFSAADEAAFRQQVFTRDKNACRYCGFTAGKYQQLHFLNGDARDLRVKNAVTACIFCHQCFTLERVTAMKAGALIWLPEFGQAALHHLARAIYVARISPGPMAEAARNAFDLLTARREEAQRRLGTDDPSMLATALQDYLEDDQYAARGDKLNGIRLMPLDRRIVRDSDIEFNQFPQILAYWRSKDGPFGGALPQSWNASFEELAAKAA
jgi:intracellular multiplication protein IcmJ